jgi:hypothetical protein
MKSGALSRPCRNRSKASRIRATERRAELDRQGRGFPAPHESELELVGTHSTASLRARLKNVWLPRPRPSSVVLGFAGNFEDEDEGRGRGRDANQILRHVPDWGRKYGDTVERLPPKFRGPMREGSMGRCSPFRFSPGRRVGQWRRPDSAFFCRSTRLLLAGASKVQ